MHTPDRDRQVASGALAEPGPIDLERLHTSLRRLHALHAPHVAARQAFEAALADAIHEFHDAGDQPAVRRILAEFPATDHAHLIFSTPARAAARCEPRPLDPPDLSPRTSSPPLPLDLSSRTPSPDTSRSAAPTLALIADVAHALLPARRPPANLDEARRFLDRLTDTLRSLAAGVGALQHLRLQQARDLDLSLLDLANPLLTRTDADELLADLLAWHEPTDRGPELLDAFAVLTAHARAHICAALAATRHLAAELAPLVVERHAARGLLRSRACWHSFRDRYAACLGDGAVTSGTLRASFRAAYLEELNHNGLPATPRRS